MTTLSSAPVFAQLLGLEPDFAGGRRIWFRARSVGRLTGARRRRICDIPDVLLLPDPEPPSNRQKGWRRSPARDSPALVKQLERRRALSQTPVRMNLTRCIRRRRAAAILTPDTS